MKYSQSEIYLFTRSILLIARTGFCDSIYWIITKCLISANNLTGHYFGDILAFCFISNSGRSVDCTNSILNCAYLVDSIHITSFDDSKYWIITKCLICASDLAGHYFGDILAFCSIANSGRSVDCTNSMFKCACCPLFLLQISSISGVTTMTTNMTWSVVVEGVGRYCPKEEAKGDNPFTDTDHSLK